MAELVRAPVSHRARPARSGADPDRIRGARQRLDQLADLPAPVDAGRPLPPRLADFGADLATIRLHHDWFADELTGALDAEAVTHGPHVYLAADAPDPSTPAGWMLMVHELFHSISHHAPGSSSEEPEAERAGLVASRASEAADGPPVVLADPTGPDPVDRRESGPLPRPRFAGARRLGRRARAASVRAGSDKSRVPDVVSAGEALVRLVSRLFERNPDDHGGRLASVLARLEPRLRDDVVTAVADRSGGHVGAQLHELEGQRPAEDGGHPVDGDGPTVDFIEKPGATDPDADQAPPVGETPRVARASRVGESPAAGGTPADIIGPAAEPTPGEGSDTPADRTSGAAPPAATEGAGGELGGDSVADEQSPARAAVQTPPVEPPSSTGATTPAGPAGAAPGEAPAPEVPMGGEAPTATGPLPGTAAADGPASGPSVAPDGEPTSAGIEPEVAATPAEPADPQTTDPDAGSAPVGSALADGAADGDTMGGGAATGEQIEDVTEADIPGTETAGPEPLSAPVDNAEADAGRVPEIDQRPTEDASTSSADDSAEPAPESAPEPEPATESEATAPESSSTGGASASGEPAAPPESTGPERVGSTDGTVDSATSGGGPADNRVEPATETEPATEPTADPAGAAADPAAVAAAAGISTTGAGDGGELTDPPVPSGGGGGGGAAIADKPVADPPDVSAMDPAGALGAAAAMPATRLLVALGGVTAAAGREIGAENADLTAHPPSMQRPSGVPADRDASLPPAALPPLPVAPDRTVPGLAGGPGAEPPTAAAPPSAPAPVTVRVPEATAGGETQVSAEDAKRIQTAVRALPTTDPALDVDAGPVPVLELAGGEDPQQIEDQATSVEEATTGAQRDGLADARADMGENDVFPQIPAERLTADIGTSAGATTAAPAGAAPAAAQTPAGSGATGGAGQGAGGPGGPGPDTGGRVPAAAIDAVVAEQSTDQIAAATREQGAALGAARTDHDTSVEQARTDTDKAINDEITANGGEQTQARRDVRGAVGRERRDWVGEQDRAAGDSRTAAGKAAEQARGGIGEARSKARTDAGAAILDGNENITKERSKAEKSAREEREKAEKESDDGGFFSWLGSKIRSFVNRIKSAIHAVFELARKAVDAVISAAQKLAVAAIEIGRRAVVAAIDLAGKALIAAGDIVLAAFPEARDRFRAKIKEKVDGAKEAVNELADKLKAGVTKLLDALGGLLKGALTLLEKAYTAAIDAVGKVIDSAIKAARVFVDALLDFAALIADIASDPIQWIKNLGAGLLDGVRNHVWGALVGAVKTWFKEKVEEIIGLGRVILDVLRKGGITFTRIVSMAWTAIKESLPGIVIQLLIEKLVAMLIPAGGAIALIIDGIKAAWGAASKILAAFGKFMAFLKAVKSGRSGPLFGDLVGAAAVAVLDFVANWVLSKLKGPGQKVGGALQKMAKRIMTAIKKVAKVVKAGAKAAAGAIRRGAKAVVGLVKRGAAAAGRVVRRVMPRNVLALGRKAVAKVRATVRRGIAKAKAGYTRAEERLFGKPKPKETSQQRLARIVGIIGPQIQGWFDRGVGRFGLIARLTGLRLRHRLRALKPEWAGQRVVVRARVNPEAQAAVAWSPGSELRRLVGEVAAELLRDPEVVRAARAAQAQAEAGQPVLVQSGPQYLGAASATHGRVDRQQTSFLVGQHQPVRRGSSEQTGTPFTATPAPLKGRSAEVFEGQQKMRSDSREGGSTSDVAQLSAGDAGKILALQQHQVVAGHENYLDVSEGLGDLAQRATGDRDSGPAMLESFVRTGSASLSRKPERKRLGRFAGLLGVVETARDPAHAADLAMATDLVGQKRGRLSAVLGGHPDDPITAADLFTRPSPAGERERGGILPMTHTGAQRAAFDVSVSDAMADVDRLDAPGPAGSNQPSRPNLEHARNDQERTAMSFAHRRMLLAERWVELKMQADPEAFKDRESAAIAIENRLRQYFGLALKTPGGQLPGGGS